MAATTVVVNGSDYSVPGVGDKNWGQNVTDLLIALAVATPGNSGYINYVAVSTTPVAVVSGRTYLVNTSVARSLNLPAPAANAFFHVKDVTGSAASNNITIVRNGTELIDGVAGNKILALNNASWSFMCDGTNWYTWQDDNLRVLLANTQTITGAKTFTSSIVASAAHHAFGVGAALGNIGVRFTNSFVSPGGLGGFTAGLDIDPTMTGGPGDTSYQTYVNIAGFGITTQAGEAVLVVASLRVTDPQINVGAAGSVGVAANIYSDVVPTEGAVNAAIYVNTGVVMIPSGDAVTPTLVSKDDRDTGLFWPSSNALAVAANGIRIMQWDASSAYHRSGTLGAPGMTFIADDNSGLYSVSADIMGVIAGGVLATQVTVTGLQMNGGSAANPILSGVGDSNTGFAWLGSDVLVVATAGTEWVRFGSTGITTFSAPSSTAILVQSAYSGNGLGIFVDNTSNTASSAAVISVRVAGTTADDAYYTVGIAGTQTYSFGVDNSVSGDPWVLSRNATLGTNNAISVSGTTSAVELQGSTTNDAAAAGKVGETITSSVSNQNVGATGTYYDITSISLTAGDWDVSAIQELTANGATFSSTLFEFGVGTATGNSATGMTLGFNYIYHQAVVPVTFTAYSMTLASYRLSVSATTTYYLKGYVAAYTVATPKVWGTITARRRR